MPVRFDAFGIVGLDDMDMLKLVRQQERNLPAPSSNVVRPANLVVAAVLREIHVPNHALQSALSSRRNRWFRVFLAEKVRDVRKLVS
jgi:hypothetical protein